MNIKYLYVIPRMKFFSEGYRGRVMHALGVAEGISKINDENKVYLLGGSDLSKYFNDVPSNTELIEITESPGLLGYLNWQIKMYKEAKKRMISGDINHLIIRYNISSYLFIFLLSNICNQITKTIEVNYFAFQEYFNNHRNILNKIITFFEIKLVNNFSVLYVVSDKAANDSRLTKLKSKVVSIPNGVTSKPIIFNAKKKKENNKTRLLYLGTLMYYWDWEPIIKAFNNSNDLYELHFYGDGPKFEYLKNSFKQNQVVKFHGQFSRNNLGSILDENYDVLFLPPKTLKDMKNTGGLSTKAFDYLSMKLPIIAPSDGELLNVYAHRHNCLFYNRNKPDEINKAVQQISHDADLRKNLSKNAYLDFSNNYSWESRMKTLINSINSINK
jgi:glycosyltransferase involved in cell wall biosynthesis